jgi:hypothetical protein
MSGPIVRKYGFPNFEKIFGERGLQHGVEESETPELADQSTAEPEASSTPGSEAKAKPKPAPKKSKKK